MATSVERIASLIAEKMLHLGDGNLSRHLDEILNKDDILSLNSEWLLPLFAETVRIVHESGDDRTVIWVIGLQCTQFINLAETFDVNNLLLEAENSTIYLNDNTDFMIEAFQEYRKSITIPLKSKSIRAVYRSWRSDISEKNGWEFSNDLYLWSSAETADSRGTARR